MKLHTEFKLVSLICCFLNSLTIFSGTVQGASYVERDADLVKRSDESKPNDGNVIGEDQMNNNGTLEDGEQNGRFFGGLSNLIYGGASKVMSAAGQVGSALSTVAHTVGDPIAGVVGTAAEQTGITGVINSGLDTAKSMALDFVVSQMTAVKKRSDTLQSDQLNK